MRIKLLFLFSIALVAAFGYVASTDMRTPANKAPEPAILVGAGDIADCARDTDEKTATLLERFPSATVFTTGDNVYPSGKLDTYERCYEPSWGRVKSRTRPATGNHDFAEGIEGYFAYFGKNAGTEGKAYYSYDLGGWHIAVLDSECRDGCDIGSKQYEWLKHDLEASRSSCTMAMWHHPVFSSSMHGNTYRALDLWKLLYDFSAEVVVNGHDHSYERFAPQDREGKADPQGIREFVVGTGGKDLYANRLIQSNSEIRNTETFGIMKFDLRPGSYAWEFIPVEGSTFTDRGEGTCFTRQ